MPRKNSKQTRETTNADYSVGYGRPPLNSRFPPGVSGNPRGRPRGASGLNAAVRDLSSRRIRITENGKSKLVSVPLALLLKLLHQGLSGDQRAAQMLLGHLGHADAAIPTSPPPGAEVEQAKQAVRERAMKLLTAAQAERERKATQAP